VQWIIIGGTDLYHEKPVRIDGDLADIRTGHVLNTSQNQFHYRIIVNIASIKQIIISCGNFELSVHVDTTRAYITGDPLVKYFLGLGNAQENI
jgi:hypothetical protein